MHRAAVDEVQPRVIEQCAQIAAVGDVDGSLNRFQAFEHLPGDALQAIDPRVGVRRLFPQ